MKQYVRYLSYISRHKYYVFRECVAFGLFWRGVFHDMDKLRPSSFIAYANQFYNKDGTKKQIRDETGYYKPTDTGNPAFEKAWFEHTRRNDHHWQYWILAIEEGEEKMLEMPWGAVQEMICDWIGAGKAQGTPNSLKWWNANKHKMRFNINTKVAIRSALMMALEMKRIEGYTTEEFVNAFNS